MMSPKGMCIPYFRSSGLAINQDVYLEDCIKTSTIDTKNYSKSFILGARPWAYRTHVYYGHMPK
jgi:hypothetical protein